MQSKQWKHPGSPPLKKVHSAGNVIDSIIWDSQGVIMKNYLEPGHKINLAYYASELLRVRHEIAKKLAKKTDM